MDNGTQMNQIPTGPLLFPASCQAKGFLPILLKLHLFLKASEYVHGCGLE